MTDVLPPTSTDLNAQQAPFTDGAAVITPKRSKYSHKDSVSSTYPDLTKMSFLDDINLDQSTRNVATITEETDMDDYNFGAPKNTLASPKSTKLTNFTSATQTDSNNNNHKFTTDTTYDDNNNNNNNRVAPQSTVLQAQRATKSFTLNDPDWLGELAEEILEAIDEYADDNINDDDDDFVPESHKVENLESLFEMKKELGKGATARVVLAYNKKTKQDVALKQLRKDDETNWETFSTESRILNKISHPNMAKYYGCYIDKFNYYIATEYCKGGNLVDGIRQFDHFSEKQASRYIKTICEAVMYLHGKNIVHRDLKPGNLVLDDRIISLDSPQTTTATRQFFIENKDTNKEMNELKQIAEHGPANNNNNDDDDDIGDGGDYKYNYNGGGGGGGVGSPRMDSVLSVNSTMLDVLSPAQLKLIDFGIALEIDDEDQNDEYVGTVLYLPPEACGVRTGKELKAGDMWSIGVIAYILLTGFPPFHGPNLTMTMVSIMSDNVCWPDDIKLSDECKDFVTKLLNKCPKTRMTAIEAMNHKWIRENHRLSEMPLGDVHKANMQKFQHTGKCIFILPKITTLIFIFFVVLFVYLLFFFFFFFFFF